MSIRRVPPDEAAALLAEGWVYVDVRSIPEFEQGHPRGAYNVPFQHRQGSQMLPNPDFLRVFASTFGKDERVVVGCGSGGRSLRAAESLAAAGFTNLVDMRGGFGGDAATKGWRAQGLPTETATEPGKSYAELAAKP
jgi:rhodanese-related sulfurtransferase